MKISVWFLLIFFLVSIEVFAQANKPKNRLEELFLWKIADELSLTIPEERAFGDLFRKQSEQKLILNNDIQETLKHMSDAKTKPEKEKLLSSYRKLLKRYQDLNLDEVDQVSKIFGTEKATKYFALKNDLNNQLKNLIATPNAIDKPKAMEPPKVIEVK